MLIRLAAVLLGSALLAVAADPVKVAVRTLTRSLRAGNEVEIEVALEDSASQPAKAPKQLRVSVEVKSADGAVAPLGKISFEPGQQVKRARYTLPNPGLQYLWARQAELLGGGTFVKVTGRPAPPSSPAEAPKPAFPAASQASPPRSPAEAARLAFPVASPASHRPTLALRYSPQRRLLANGRESATIQAFLMGDDCTASADIRIRFASSGGRLEPAPLVIPHGADYGEAELTSDEAGTAVVEYMNSDPPVALDGDRALKIAFDPPISSLSLSASPSAISLVDFAELIVTLSDDAGRPVPTALDRKVSLALVSGRGSIEPEVGAVLSQGFETRATLRPFSSGHFVISASTPNLLTRTAEIDVLPPWLLLGLSALGGIAGAWLAVRERHMKRWRIPAGALTGFLFYWAVLFGLLPVLPRMTILNPLSAAAISALGGWGGSEVLRILWKRIVPA